ncbi:MAG: inositol monophosphatase [Patescibacteria group bacterium]|nr:inositol monophosphatase [Patescibacteria group bacterium]
MLGFYGQKHHHFEKGDRTNFATQADLEAEKIITSILTKEFPTHDIIAEENGQNNRGSEYTWVIDPLDGTISFATDMPFFVVSIALLEQMKPVLGVIYWVTEDKMYVAQKGKGAFMNDQKIKVSLVDKLQNAVMAVDFGHANSRKRKVDTYMVPLMYRTLYQYALCATALHLTFVAQGMLDGFPNDANIWDVAAGVLLVEEAGGKVTDLEGNEPDWSKKRLDIVASNGLIHEQILEVLKNSDKSLESRV